MHGFPDGWLRTVAAWLFFILCKMGLDLKEVNGAIKRFRHWPKDTYIPPLHSGLKKGIKGGRPRPGAVVRMSASQMMHFALRRCLSPPPYTLLSCARGGRRVQHVCAPMRQPVCLCVCLLVCALALVCCLCV